jgi:hypothetical protein
VVGKMLVTRTTAHRIYRERTFSRPSHPTDFQPKS